MSARRPSRSTDSAGRTSPRGISPADVDRAADALLHDGERPTVEKVRFKIGRGSPNTINPLLDAWWKRLAGRLDAGPAALHRLPQAVAMAAEALWLNALQQARERVSIEQRSAKAASAQDRQELEIRSHVLSIREAELNDRIAERDRRIERLERELGSLMRLLRQEQAVRALREQTPAPSTRPGRAPKPAAGSRVGGRRRIAVKPGRNSPRRPKAHARKLKANRTRRRR